MYLIVRKKDNVLLMMGNQLDYMSNGYPRLVEEDVAFVTEQVNVFDVAEVPEEAEPEKYCYTEEDGFYLNENWTEPNKYGIPDETVQTIKDDTVAELIELGVL